ncbi:5-dehydro-4-deoxy-D-glucuronate isomerase [Methylobrevis albus]|uniref:4-deoxy-L-threo-5-hexosulose-uronate ketol-isomerase n=1 Tax=Methylobrevis albus TaxID=2793297 RepID=A0A931I1I9_9HYPH|nr:5-dehydro-4-deoxy-D-glucuronate isomerase [Methylobrevis albus]MBH0237694.1 5-dehydro-4-deoxy-D-glucuronate isomerase [Methylobrevis albus]
MPIETRHAIHPEHASMFDTEALRANFLIQGLFVPGEINLTYSHYERLVVGGAAPAGSPLTLEPAKATGTPFFLARRELGIINVGGAGTVTADGERFELGARDVLYVAQGTKEVTFASADAAAPALFYLVSTPAHQRHATRRIAIAEAKRVELGAQETANKRTIFQLIHPDVCTSCQLVMGMTQLEPGSVWNTMPAHVHDRRSEAYLYFDLAAGAKVFHLMGEPEETRHLVVGDREAILSPPWSIHSGCGTSAYAFVWAMGGDNIDYTDMDPVTLEMLK